MDENRLEKHMKDRLSRYESFTDSNALWDAIEAKQSKSKSKPWWLFLFVLIFIGLIGSATIYFLNTDEKAIRTTDVPQNLSSENNTQVKNSITNLKAKEIQTADQIITNTKTEDIDAQINDQAIKKNDLQNTTQKQNSTDPLTALQESNYSNTTSKNPIENQNLFQEEQIEKTNEAVITLVNTTNSPKESIDLTEENTFQPHDEAEILAKNPIEVTNEAIASGISQEKLIENIEALPLLILYLSYHEVIAPPKINYESLLTGSKIDQSLAQTANNTNRLSGINFGLSGTYSFPFRSLELNGDTSLLNYVNLRSDQETSLELLRYDLLVGYKFENNLSVHSGLSWSQLTEKFEIEQTIEKQILVDTITQILVYKDSTTSSIQGMVEGTEITKTKERYYNRYQSLDIPIQFGYENVLSHSKWGYYGSLAALINLQFKKSGYITDPYTSEISAINDIGDGDFWRTKQSLRLNLGAGLMYQLNPNFALKLGPQFEYSTRAITVPGAAVQQKYQYLGVKLHASYTFGKRF